MSYRIDANELIRLVCVTGCAANRVALSGTQSPAQAAYWKRTQNPKVGDLVVEKTTIWYSASDPAKAINAIGTLELIDRELTEDEEGNLSIDLGPRYHIRTFDGRLHTWGNASFVAVPRTMEELGAWQNGEG